MKALKLAFLFLLFALVMEAKLALGANSYLLLWNSIKVDVKGETFWISRSLIRVDDPSSFPSYLSWKYDSERSDLTIERLRLRRADGRVELLSLEVREYGKLLEKRASLEGLRSGDTIEVSFSFKRSSPLSPYFWWYFPYCGEMEVNKFHLEVSSPVGFVSNESFSNGVLEKENLSSNDILSPISEPVLLTSIPSWDRAFALFSPPSDSLSLSELEGRLSRVPGLRGKVELIWKVLSEKRVLEGWSFSDQGYRFSTLKDIWERKEVTPSDLSVLVYHILKGIGLSPEMVWVSEWPLSEKYPVPSLLSHPLIRVVIEDKTYWLDPYALGLPPGYIHPRFQGKRGIVFSQEGVRFVDVPVLSENLSSEEVNLSLDVSSSGSYDFSMNVISRGWLVDKLKRLSDMEGIKDITFENKGYAVVGKASGRGKVSLESFERRIVLTLPGVSFPLDFLSLPLRRRYPIDLGFLRSFEHNITLKYPSGWKVKTLPSPFVREEGAFSVSARFTEKGKNRIALNYSFKLKKKVLSPEEWASLRRNISILDEYIKGHILFEGEVR